MSIERELALELYEILQHEPPTLVRFIDSFSWLDPCVYEVELNAGNQTWTLWMYEFSYDGLFSERVSRAITHVQVDHLALNLWTSSGMIWTNVVGARRPMYSPDEE